jgi:hypothetical protein
VTLAGSSVFGATNFGMLTLNPVSFEGEDGEPPETSATRIIDLYRRFRTVASFRRTGRKNSLGGRNGNAKGAPNPITRESLVPDLRGLAEQAEGTGDRWVAPRTLNLASHIELHGPANPVPPSVDKLIEICDTVAGGLIRSSCENLGAAQMLA